MCLWQQVYRVCRIALQSVKTCIYYSYQSSYLFRYMHTWLVQRARLVFGFVLHTTILPVEILDQILYASNETSSTAGKTRPDS
jgi:hypothetical protein